MASEPRLVAPVTATQQPAQRPPPSPGTRVAPAPAPTEPLKPPSKWLFADLKQQGGVQDPPFPIPRDEDDREQGQGRGKAVRLFPSGRLGHARRPDKGTLQKPGRSMACCGTMSIATSPASCASWSPKRSRIALARDARSSRSTPLCWARKTARWRLGSRDWGSPSTVRNFPDGTVVAFTKATRRRCDRGQRGCRAGR